MNIELSAQEMREIGTFFKNCRIRAGITQKSLSNRLGYTTPQFVSNWERGKGAPSKEAMKVLVRVLSIQMSEFEKNVGNIVSKRFKANVYGLT